jgi:hypothetical protein
MPSPLPIPRASGCLLLGGGIIDYRLALPYARLEQEEPDAIVLYPHFMSTLCPAGSTRRCLGAAARAGRIVPGSTMS